MTPGWSYRVRDLGVSLLLLVLVAPVIAGIALLLLLVQGRPVFFVQERPGRFGRPFALVKFRTMRTSEAAAGVDDEARITRIGRVLRATSLDELPELLNVVRGDMALVGPRPLLPDYLDHYTGVEHLRHQVRPGVTGLAQVSGRNALSWPEKLALDVDYVRRRSHLLDLAILLRTVATVVRPGGSTSHPGHATMPRMDATS